MKFAISLSGSNLFIVGKEVAHDKYYLDHPRADQRTLSLGSRNCTRSAVDTDAEKATIDKLTHEYFEAYSRGDMAAVQNFISVPFMAQGPKGFTAFTTANEVLDWYTRFHDAAVKQGYAKTQWIDFGVKLLGQSYAVAGGTYVRFKTDGKRTKQVRRDISVDGVWKIGVNIGYPTKDAIKLE